MFNKRLTAETFPAEPRFHLCPISATCQAQHLCVRGGGGKKGLLLFYLLPVIEFASVSRSHPSSLPPLAPTAIEIISSGGDKINDYGPTRIASGSLRPDRPRRSCRPCSRPFRRLFLMEINYKACNLVCFSAAQRRLQKVDWKMDPKLNPAPFHTHTHSYSVHPTPGLGLSFPCKFNELEVMMFTLPS